MSDSGTRLRLFFAVRPDPIERDWLAEAALSLSVGDDAKLVPRNNYHVTLAFIGEVAAAQLATLLRIGAAQAAPALAFRFDAFEYWPKPEVVVAVARTIPEGVQALWRQLHQELAAHGWALDAKRLRPHVTLARKVSQAPVLPAMLPVNWVAREFCLMRSELGAPQPAYTVVDTWPLLDEMTKL